MSNICIINSPQDQAIAKYDVATFGLNRPLNPATRLIRSLMVRIKKENIRFFYKKDWIEKLSSFDVLVVFDSLDTEGVCQKIAKAYPQKRLVLLYWNPIKINRLKEIPESFEKWTFDYDDAKQYGMRYNGQFIFEKELNVKPAEIEYDLYFVGLNKGRFSSLLRLKENLETLYNLNVRYRLVSPIRSLFSHNYSRPIPYKQVLEETVKTKCVLEYNQKGQRGLTQRAIESLFLQKKLVTNNSNLKKKDYYKKSNIYILDNDLDSFDEFMKMAFEPYPTEVVERYYFSNWLRRIEKNEELNDTVE